MLVNFVLLLGGLSILLAGAEFFVKAAVAIAKKLSIPEFIIGATLVAVGTSIPELAASVTASLNGSSNLVLGSIIGSNIANIGLILGIASIFGVVKASEEVLHRDGYFMIFAAFLLVFTVYDGAISIIESGLFLLLYFAYTFFLFDETAKFEKKYHFKEFIKYFFGLRYLKVIGKAKSKKDGGVSIKEVLKSGILTDLVTFVVSLGLIVVGSKLFIEQAIFFANNFGVPEALVGISLVALGTSLPELSVAMSAAKKGYGNLVVGSIIGSNISNTLFILGVSASISSFFVSFSAILLPLAFMLILNVLLIAFIRSGWDIKRSEGVALVFVYLILISLLFFF